MFYNMEEKPMIPKLQIIQQDNLSWVRTHPHKNINLIYIDPPFNTGKVQEIHGKSYDDEIPNYKLFIELYFHHSKWILKDNGSFFFHIDWHESHYCKVWLDEIFGRNHFMNEIIWSYDYGGRPKNKWPNKHDTIFWYVKDPNDYVFNYDEIDRIPYMAPSLVGAEKAERGKTPTDVWWNTIVHTTGKERVNYPTQKPLSILNRIVRVHSNPGDILLDFFAGSGSFGEAAIRNGRSCILVDNNPDAADVMIKRFENLKSECEFDMEVKR